MAQMDEHIKSLEQDPELEVSIIRNTKINKVLKAILKIPEIPKEDTYRFKERSAKLLTTWNTILGTPAEATAADTPKPIVNGDSHSEAALKNGDTTLEKKEDEEPATKTDSGNDAGDEGDVTMADAKPAELETATAPAAEAPAAEETKTETPAAEATATA